MPSQHGIVAAECSPPCCRAFTDPTAQFEQGRPLALPLALFHPFGVLAKYKRSVSNSLDDLKREARFRFDPTLPTPSQEETDGLNGAAAGGEASSDKPMSPAGKGGPRDSGSVSGTASVGTLSPSRGHASPLLKRSVLPKAPSPNDGRKAQASTARDSDAMPETVPALQVLLMLALLCKAPTQDAQMRFCFSVFDLDVSAGGGWGVGSASVCTVAGVGLVHTTTCCAALRCCVCRAPASLTLASCKRSFGCSLKPRFTWASCQPCPPTQRTPNWHRMPFVLRMQTTAER